DSKLLRHVATTHQGTFLVEGKSTYVFRLADGRQVKGEDLQHQRESWLRVFRRAEASRISPGVGQPLHTRAMRSEKCMRLRGRAWVRMRVIAVFFGPCAPDVLTTRISVLSYNFKRLEIFTKLATSSRVNRAQAMIAVSNDDLALGRIPEQQ